MDEFRLTVSGVVPGPQGSKTDTGRRRISQAGNAIAILRESSRKVAPWRRAVVLAAADVRPAEPFAGAVVVDMVFSLPRPISHYRTGKYAGQIRPAVLDLPHTKKPDLSKLVRSTEDALTTAEVWEDDARVAWYGVLGKVYVGASHPDALDVPGAVIRVRSLELITVEEVTP
jgi:Holliday junction resolvase RusA-like endonuclease